LFDSRFSPLCCSSSRNFSRRLSAILLYVGPQIWVRNYQILDEQPANALEARQLKKAEARGGTGAGKSTTAGTSLVEIGPRFVLEPIRVFRGSFGGQTLFQNPDFFSPNDIRAMERRKKGLSYEDRKHVEKSRKERKEQLVLPDDPLDSVFR